MNTKRIPFRGIFVRFVYLFIALALTISNVFAVESIAPPVDKEISIGGDWEYFVNDGTFDDFAKERILSPQSIFENYKQIQWKVVEHDNASFSYDAREYWFHFKVEAPADLSQRNLIQISYPLLDYLDLYIVKGDEVLESFETGDALLFDSRPIDHQSFLFPLHFLREGVLDVYIRVQSSSTLQVPLTIWPQDKFWLDDRTPTYMDGIFFGSLMVMLIYNLFIYLSIRDKAYLFYVLYLGTMVVLQAANRGLGYQYLWSTSPSFQHQIIVPSLAAVVIFGSLFFMRLLNLKQVSRNNNLFFIVGIWASFACVILSFFVPYTIALKTTAAVITVLMLGGSVISIDLWRKGNRLAGYYSIGWGAVILSFIFYMSSLFDYVERSFFVEYSTMFGVIAEVLIFSLALADRINIERHARLSAQDALLTAQKEINRELDARVIERTQELEQLNEKLHEMSVTDGLTNVKNRRYFNEHVVIEYKRAYRELTNISLLLLDIDYFKLINDNHGHQVGDECLVALANAVKSAVKRPADAISRYGGEEFAILLPETDFQGAQHVAEKVRKTIENIDFVTLEGKRISLQVSIGSASYTPRLRDAYYGLIQLADENLYQAKAQGRNRVVATNEEKEYV